MANQADRPAQPEPFLRGCAYPSGAGATYPRADPSDQSRLPGDTWEAARIPASVRFEMVGDAEAVELSYTTFTEDLGYRGDGAGRAFELWRLDRRIDEAAAELGRGKVRLSTGEGFAADDPYVIYLPEGMRPRVESVEALGGSVEPAPREPKWLAYGDSIAEGWVASRPSGTWPAIAGRTQHLEVHNLGYAGAARGEVVSAEHLANLDAAVISVTFGTNCWTRVPHSEAAMRETMRSFLTVLRQGHPDTPVVVSSPVVRPDAEDTPNRLGTTLSALRLAIERVADERASAGDERMTLIRGRPLLSPDLLPDGIHPGDEGHRVLAGALGPAIGRAVHS